MRHIQHLIHRQNDENRKITMYCILLYKVVQQRKNRQVIMHDGVPFSLEIPQKIATRDSITEAEFNKMMATGLSQAKADDSLTIDEAFSNLRMEIAK